MKIGRVRKLRKEHENQEILTHFRCFVQAPSRLGQKTILHLEQGKARRSSNKKNSTREVIGIAGPNAAQLW